MLSAVVYPRQWFPMRNKNGYLENNKDILFTCRLAIKYQEWYYVTGNGFDTVIMGRIEKKAADADGEGGLTESEAYLWVRQFITEAES